MGKQSEQEAAHAFGVAHELLFRDEDDPLRLDDVVSVYEELFDDHTFPTLRGTSRPHFDTYLYPPLSATLLEKGPPFDFPAWENPEQLLAFAANDSPLARFLAAYIWKRGELERLTHVKAGLMSAPEQLAPEADYTDAVVMWQFGRHLRHPHTAPLFDQHTYRACQRLYALGEQRTPAPPPVKGDGRSVPGRAHLRAYVGWWHTAVFNRVERGETMSQTLYRVDMLLFSLGKAAPRMPAP